ncbi:MAG: class I SAM-dependent methyltransferase [Candidatus Paceibacterota bacterium]
MIISDRERQAPIKIEEAEPSHLARYDFALNYINDIDKVLDIPCGTGYGTKLISSKSSSVVGIDICPDAIEHAKEFFDASNIRYIVANAENLKDVLPKSDYFDVVISFEGIEHLNNQNLFLDGVNRLLKKNGTFIISTPRKPHGSPYHTIEYSLEEFELILSKFFIIEKMFGQIYTDIFDLKTRDVNPHSFKRFNYIAVCRKR